MQLTRSRTEALMARKSAAVARGLSIYHPVFAARGDGARLWDVDGKEYVDFASGIGTLNIGHRHPRVVAAVEKQLGELMHTCFQVAMYEPYIELAERLNALAPGDFPKKSAFFSAGAEATENAIKIARGATKRPGVVTFSHAFHGRTLLALTMTGKVDPYKAGTYGPYAPEVYQAPFPDARHGYDTPKALEALELLFATRIAPTHVAAVIIEPVLGEGGFVPAPFEFLRALRALCDRYGIVMIADEIQTGMGRTGTLFAIEQAGVAPDIIAFAKSIAGGMPLSGIVGRAEIVDAVVEGGIGGTFAGNPLSCAAALATLDVFEEEDVLERSRVLGKHLRAFLDGIAKRYPKQVAEVRGLGAMVAIEFEDDGDPSGKSVAQRISTAALDEGLLVLTSGPKAATLRLLAPLNIDAELAQRGCDALERACARVLGG